MAPLPLLGEPDCRGSPHSCVGAGAHTAQLIKSVCSLRMDSRMVQECISGLLRVLARRSCIRPWA